MRMWLLMGIVLLEVASSHSGDAETAQVLPCWTAEAAQHLRQVNDTDIWTVLGVSRHDVQIENSLAFSDRSLGHFVEPPVVLNRASTAVISHALIDPRGGSPESLASSRVVPTEIDPGTHSIGSIETRRRPCRLEAAMIEPRSSYGAGGLARPDGVRPQDENCDAGLAARRHAPERGFATAFS